MCRRVRRRPRRRSRHHDLERTERTGNANRTKRKSSWQATLSIRMVTRYQDPAWDSTRLRDNAEIGPILFWDCVLLVSPQGFEITLEFGRKLRKPRQREVLIHLFDFSYRLFFQAFKTHLVILSLGYQPAFLEERVIDSTIERDGSFVQGLEIVKLKVRETAELLRVDHRLEHGVRITMNMNETGVGEHFQKQLDSSRIHRRFQDQRFSVLPGQLLQEMNQRISPNCQFVWTDLLEADVSCVVIPPLRKTVANQE